jgi:hypothetical protein
VPKDKLGAEIELGDVVVYTVNIKDGGGLTIGRIEKLHESGAITIKQRSSRGQYAYEVGAPEIPRTGTRAKRDADGQYVYEEYLTSWGSKRKQITYEEYEYMDKDYSRTGKTVYYWAKTVIHIPSNVLVLRKANEFVDLEDLQEAITLDFDKEIPDGPTHED